MDAFEIEKYPQKQTDNQIIVRDHGKVFAYNARDLMQTGYGPHLQDVCTFAQLCADIYVDTDADRDPEKRDLEKNRHPQRWTGRADAAGWEKSDWQGPTLSNGFNLKSLKYAIWLDRTNKRAVVVFRGTVEAADWWSNAHWLTRFVPGINNHYKQVAHIVKPALAYLTETLGDDFRLYTAGHSLGGGLAQLFAYSSPRRAEFVCAFHSSPVTGYFQIPKRDRERASEGLLMARVFEHGEVLAYARLLSRFFYRVSTANPRIVEFRTNFIEGTGTVRQHSVADFADQYQRRLVALQEP
ncbi:MAG: hypothetical protein AAF460_14685 [Pseudomonadota bacterium]